MVDSFRSTNPIPLAPFAVCYHLCFLVTTLGFAADDAKNSADKPLIKTTHVYKTVRDVKVEADVYRSEGAGTRPVVVWIQEAGFGGAAKVP